MRILIAEDDFSSRQVMLKFLMAYGDCDVTIDGEETVQAFIMAIEDGEPYDVICLDVMMPIVDGYQALEHIRSIEEKNNVPEDKKVKVIMTTALNEGKNVEKAYDLGCTEYCVKPINISRLKSLIEKFSSTL